MINAIWLLLLAGGIIYAGVSGRIDVVTHSAITAAEGAVTLALKLTGVMCLWLGILRIAEKAGVVSFFSRIIGPMIRFLFPAVPPSHQAIGAITMTVSANMLGLGNAVTPFGIKAMEELKKLNGGRDSASPAMCTMVALCTTGFTLVPATIVAIRSAAGSEHPAKVVGAIFAVSLLSTVAALAVDRVCQWLYRGQGSR